MLKAKSFSEKFVIKKKEYEPKAQEGFITLL